MANVRFLKADVERMFSMYERGKTQKAIAEAFETTQDRVSQLFKRFGFKCSSTNSRYYNNGLDKAYFDRIDSFDKAYFLGLIVSSGYVKGGDYGIVSLSLDSHEQYVLELLRTSIGSDNQIVDRMTRNRSVSTFTVRSMELVKSLRRYGFDVDNGERDCFPILSNDMMPHFIRGIFDGSGWISTVNHEIGFCGKRNVIDGLRQFLVEKLMVSQNSVSEDRGMFRVAWGKDDDFARICAYIYENKENCYFIQKYCRFIDVMDYFVNRPFRFPSERIRVRQFSLNGDFIKEHENCLIAAKAVGISAKRILRCCRKQSVKCGGFVFRFNPSDYFSVVPKEKREIDLETMTDK